MIPLIALTLGLIVSTPCHATTKPDILTADTAEKSFLVTVDNPIISIPIESNRTTGYNWYLEEYNDKLIQPLESQYTTSHEGLQASMVGAPGVTTWKFKVLESAFRVPTVTKVVLRYAKSWSHTASITKTLWIYTSDTGVQVR
jgi:predicted secreted protein